MKNEDTNSYYILVGKNKVTGSHELVFGDYNLENVESERGVMGNNTHKDLRIRRTSGKPVEINKAVASLNAA